MSEKTLKTRIQNKRGTTAEWAAGTAPNFVPWDGEIVAYTDVHRIKIGDGTTKVSDLPFVDKVRDVTLGGESIVNENGVVELQQTEMTDNYIPVWNNTTGTFEDGVTAEGTLGYVLTAQGSGKKPIWKAIDTSAPTNMVTTDTEQLISGSKHFTKDITIGSSDNNGSYTTGYSTVLSTSYLNFGLAGYTAKIDAAIGGSSPSSRTFTLPQVSGTFAIQGNPAYFSNYGNAGNIFSCRGGDGEENIFTVYDTGNDACQLIIGGNTTPVTVNLNNAIFTSNIKRATSSTAVAYTQLEYNGLLVNTSSNSGTTYKDGSVVRKTSASVTNTYSFPIMSNTATKTGTVAIIGYNAQRSLSYYNVNFSIKPTSTSSAIYTSWGVVARSGYTSLTTLIQNITGSTTAGLNVVMSTSIGTIGGSKRSLGYMSTNGVASQTTCYCTDGYSFTPYSLTGTITSYSIA